jgi:hypothetical protein
MAGAGISLAQVRKIALALPEATESPHFQATSFRVRGKIFATAPDEQTLHVFVGEEPRSQALALYPAFIEKLPWGAKIVGLRIHLSAAESAVVADLLTLAWRAKAPKALQ